MKGDIIFAHKLVQLDLFGVLPPFLPFISVVGSDGGISNKPVIRKTYSEKRIPNGGIKPDVKDLVFVTVSGDLGTPFEVPGNAPRFQSFLEPSSGNIFTVGGPSAYLD